MEDTPNDQYKNERYKFYGSQQQMPSHAKTKQKVVEDQLKNSGWNLNVNDFYSIKQT